LLKNGKVSHGRLGVTIQEVSQSLAESFGLKNTAGALISSVEKGSPAAAAGLEAGRYHSSNWTPPEIGQLGRAATPGGGDQTGNADRAAGLAQGSKQGDRGRRR
jgi:S1-C subfamily serine protease